MKEQFHILLAGTTSSGKSTLLYELWQRKKQLPTELQAQLFLGRERARPLLRMNPHLFSEPAFQQILHWSQLALEQRALSLGAKVAIWDSGVPVNLGYARRLEVPLEPTTRANWIAHSKKYQKVYLLNKDDVKLQLTSLHQQTAGEKWHIIRQQIHSDIIWALAECGLAYELLSGSVANRLEVVWAQILQALQVESGQDE